MADAVTIKPNQHLGVTVVHRPLTHTERKGTREPTGHTSSARSPQKRDPGAQQIHDTALVWTCGARIQCHLRPHLVFDIRWVFEIREDTRSYPRGNWHLPSTFRPIYSNTEQTSTEFLNVSQ